MNFQFPEPPDALYSYYSILSDNQPLYVLLIHIGALFKAI